MALKMTKEGPGLADGIGCLCDAHKQSCKAAGSPAGTGVPRRHPDDRLQPA